MTICLFCLSTFCLHTKKANNHVTFISYINSPWLIISFFYCNLDTLAMSLGTESRNLLIFELEVDWPSRRCPWPSKTTCSRLESSFSWIQIRIVVGFTSTPEKR